MFSLTDGKVIGFAEREGKNGKYNLLSFVSDGEAYQIMCSKDVYDLAKNMDFGEETKITLDVRRFGRDWSLRVIGIEAE